MIILVVITLSKLLATDPQPAPNPYLAQVRAWPVTPSVDGVDETPEQWEQRSTNIAQAIAEVDVRGPIPLPALRSAVLVVWHRESGFARDVHAGKRGRNGSDGGRAACLGQLHRNRKLTADKWQATKGTDLEATKRCALWTARALQSAASTCRFNGSRQSWRRVFRQYGTGNGDCNPDKATGHSRSEIDRRSVLVLRRYEGGGK